MRKYKGGFKGVHPLQVYSTPLQILAERGSGKSCSSVSLDNLCLTVMVEEGGRIEALVVAKRLGDGP